MHVVENQSAPKNSKKIYRSVLLRESYRENGKVKKRTIANLSYCSPEEIAAIKLALRHKGDLTVLGSIKECVELHEGLSMGAVWMLYQVGRELGLEKVLGTGFEGRLAFWQVMARVIDQGSRLSAVRLAQVHGVCDVLGMKRGFDENDLYENLEWLSDHQGEIERGLFLVRRGGKAGGFFLYDVTSSYLEGEKNYFGAYGYSRDGKRGKQQIVIGLLCDEEGDPVGVEVFSGNTVDWRTFGLQVRKVAEGFGCREVTWVGDRGMIKRAQVEQLPEGFHYITAITKPQIEKLVREGVFQMELFEEGLGEVEEGGVRYILRRNPVRAEEVRKGRLSKRREMEGWVERKNGYLREHPKADVEGALAKGRGKLEGLRVGRWLKLKAEGRSLKLEEEEEALREESLLDGCYVIKTDLSRGVADKERIHERYKDLAEVERGFRDCKTGLLEVRPVYVRTEKSTRGHVLVVMLAYLMVRRLRKAWAALDMTVEEGIHQLSTLCSMEVRIKGQSSHIQIPSPREKSQELLKALGIQMPAALPHREVRVVTRKKLPEQRRMP